jgi:hypothetical protein
MEARVAEYMMPAPGEGAGNDAGRTKPQDRRDYSFIWARPEINKLDTPWRLRAAALLALSFAAMVHEAECESRWVGYVEGWVDLPSIPEVAAAAAIQRRANPMILMRFLPPEATENVRREAERLLRWIVQESDEVDRLLREAPVGVLI